VRKPSFRLVNERGGRFAVYRSSLNPP